MGKPKDTNPNFILKSINLQKEFYSYTINYNSTTLKPKLIITKIIVDLIRKIIQHVRYTEKKNQNIQFVKYLTKHTYPKNIYREY